MKVKWIIFFIKRTINWRRNESNYRMGSRSNSNPVWFPDFSDFKHARLGLTAESWNVKDRTHVKNEEEYMTLSVIAVGILKPLYVEYYGLWKWVKVRSNTVFKPVKVIIAETVSRSNLDFSKAFSDGYELRYSVPQNDSISSNHLLPFRFDCLQK